MRLSRLFGKTDVTSDVVINIQPEIQFFEKMFIFHVLPWELQV